MPEMMLIRCPVCEEELIGVVDIPMIRSLAITCPHCISLAVTIMLERNQPANPYTPAVPEDPDGWRVQSVLAGRTPRAAWRRRKNQRRA